jgi:hypothetical protein
MDRFLINAKPYASDASPYKLNIYPLNSFLSSVPLIEVFGRNFINVRNVYLSASNPNIFPNTTNYYNPFSSVKNLSAENPAFYASIVDVYNVYTTRELAFFPSEYPNGGGYVDIIIENEAGYGLLSRDSIVPSLSSFSNSINFKKPCVSGIHVNIMNL